jgi:glycosyltransferase involved in cell wall biosynthesis
LYAIGSDEKKFDAVCNSKPKSFKRHALSSLVENKIFITYGAPGTFESSSLRSFNPLEIFTNIPAKDVAALLNKSMVGLILSEEEGACYASTEYLLCGLPVVSTKSRGGRDEYYTEENSVVVDPKAEAVRDAVALLCARLRNGELSPARIREGAVRKTTEFRENFLLNLRHLLQEEANAEAVVTEISRLMTRYSKMGPLRNWFRKTV